VRDNTSIHHVGWNNLLQ